MPDTNEAASPASPAVGDGSKKSSSTENVSESQAVSHFMRMEEKRAKEATADTEAKEVQAPEEGGEPNADGEAKTTPPTEAEAKPETEATEATEQEATETEAKEEGKEEADEVLSPETQNLDAKTKQKIQKRIDREVGKRKALEDQVKQLNEKLAQISQPQPTPEAPKAAPVTVGKPPLPDIKDVAALKEYQKSAKETVRWAEEVLDRDDIDQGVTIGNKEYTKADIKAVLRNAKTALEDHIPAQQEWFQQNQQFQQQKQTFTKQAQEKFPFLADRNSPEYKWAQQFYQSAPWLHNLAASEWFVGAYIKGMNALQAEEKAAEAAKAKGKEPEAKPKVVIPKAKAPSDQAEVSSTGTPQRLTPDASSNRALGVEYEKLRAKRGVTSEDAAKFLEKRDTLRQR